MIENQPNNPLHGITLEMILSRLVERYGWNELGTIITIKCFNHDPSITSSLKFLRKTPWARKKVEDLYLRGEKKKKGKRRKGPARDSRSGHIREGRGISPVNPKT